MMMMLQNLLLVIKVILIDFTEVKNKMHASKLGFTFQRDLSVLLKKHSKKVSSHFLNKYE